MQTQKRIGERIRGVPTQHTLRSYIQSQGYPSKNLVTLFFLLVLVCQEGYSCRPLEMSQGRRVSMKLEKPSSTISTIQVFAAEVKREC